MLYIYILYIGLNWKSWDEPTGAACSYILDSKSSWNHIKSQFWLVDFMWIHVNSCEFLLTCSETSRFPGLLLGVVGVAPRNASPLRVLVGSTLSGRLPRRHQRLSVLDLGCLPAEGHATDAAAAGGSLADEEVTSWWSNSCGLTGGWTMLNWFDQPKWWCKREIDI
jgi:hypothetical protein